MVTVMDIVVKQIYLTKNFVNFKSTVSIDLKSISTLNQAEITFTSILYEA